MPALALVTPYENSHIFEYEGFMSRSLFVCCGMLGLVLASCSTHEHNLTSIRRAYHAGNLQSAEAKIDRAMKRRSKDADVLKLDRALVLLHQGKAREAEKLLRETSDRFDHLERKSIGEMAMSMVTDDQAMAYHGEDYEKVLIRAFLALSNLMHDGSDANAYALQVAAKQQEIIQRGQSEDGKNPKLNYKQVAVGAYIHAALREATHTNYDDAERSLKLVCDWAPEFHSGPKELRRVKHGRHSSPGNGVLYVFTLVGRGPYKKEEVEPVSSAAMAIASVIVSATAKRSVPLNLAPIKVPRVVVPHNYVQQVGVHLDGKPAGVTETITDIGRMAKEQSDALLPYVVARAVVRRTLKNGIVYGVKEAAGIEKNSLPDLALHVAGIAWQATESADTRCWGVLPEKIQVLRVELPAGKHQLALRPLNAHNSPQGPAATTVVDIANGRNTYVLAGFPSGQLVGKIVTSQPR